MWGDLKRFKISLHVFKAHLKASVPLQDFEQSQDTHNLFIVHGGNLRERNVLSAPGTVPNFDKK